MKIRQRASDWIKTKQEYETERANKGHGKTKTYAVGDFVVVRNVDTTVGSNKKFVPRYKGPYVIYKILGNDRYVVRDINNCQLTQLPYDGVIEAHRIRDWRQPPDECADEPERDPLELS